jgi:hypothetical protein
MRDLWTFRPRGCLTNPFRTLSLCFGLIGKTPGLISRNNFVKKFFCLHRPSRWCFGNMWLDLPFAQVSRSVEQNVHITFSLRNSLSHFEELQSWGRSKILPSILMRFEVIIDQTSNSSNVYLSSSRFWTAISLVIFYQFPSLSKSRIPLETFDQFGASFP